MIAMQEELDQFERNKVWSIVPPPENQFIIGTKWVFKNKLNEDGEIVKNKVRVVAQGYCQEEVIDFDEILALVARLEPIRMMLAFECHHDCVDYQMDVKSAYPNGYIKEEVYVKQPIGFEDPKYINHMFKLHKALYSLKQVLRAW